MICASYLPFPIQQFKSFITAIYFLFIGAFLSKVFIHSIMVLRPTKAYSSEIAGKRPPKLNPWFCRGVPGLPHSYWNNKASYEMGIQISEPPIQAPPTAHMTLFSRLPLSNLARYLQSYKGNYTITLQKCHMSNNIVLAFLVTLFQKTSPLNLQCQNGTDDLIQDRMRLGGRELTWTVGSGCGTNWKNRTDIHTTMCVRQIANGNLL